MALNYIWIGFFLVGLLVAIIRVAGYFLQTHADMIFGITFTHADRDVFQAIVQSTFHMAKTSVDLSIYLIGVMALWLGIMKIGEKGGAVTMLSKLVSPFFRKIFPEIPDKHPAMSSIMMNFCANMLGLDNAATPFGIKAMQDLQELNPKKDTASNAQIMFLVLNTSALTVIPISILAYRAAAHSANPAEVFLPLLLATFFSTMAGLIAVSIVQRINLFKPVVLLYLGVISGLIALLFLLLHNMSHARIGTFSIFSGNQTVNQATRQPARLHDWSDWYPTSCRRTWTDRTLSSSWAGLPRAKPQPRCSSVSTGTWTHPSPIKRKKNQRWLVSSMREKRRWSPFVATACAPRVSLGR